MNTTEEIIGLEKKFWQAMIDHDVDAAINLTRFPCVISGPQGTRFVTEEDFRKMFEMHPGDSFKNIDLQKTRVEILGSESAIITYETEMSGKKMSDISTWVRSGDKWVCAFHMEAPVQ
jgi:hypothetical protein